MGKWGTTALTLGVGAVGATAWFAAHADRASPTNLYLIVLAAVVASFAPSFVDWRLESAKQRKRALGVAQPRDGTRAGLLHPDRRVISFVGREREYDLLKEWCRDENPPVRLMVGAGGVGKTRLALELGRYQQEAGWSVTWVRPGQEAEAAELAKACRRRLLLIVDYAENRPELPKLVDEASENPTHVRLLLIARGIGDWWRTLAVKAPADGPLLLSEQLAPESLSPPELVRTAISEFAEELGVAAPTVGAIAVPGRVPVLVLQATALVAVLRSQDTGGRPIEELVADHGVLDELLQHERRYWSVDDGLPGDLTVRSRAVAVTCLFPAKNEEDAALLLSRVPDLSEDRTARYAMARWLTVRYPVYDLEEDGAPPTEAPERPAETNQQEEAKQRVHWGYLQPELVSEHHVLTQILECPALVLTDLTALRPEQLRQMLTVLSLATAHSQPGQDLLNRLLRENLPELWKVSIAVATTSGGGLCPVLQRVMSGAGDLTLLREVEKEIPFPTTQLAETAVTVAGRLLTTDSTPSKRAARLKWLGILEGQAGAPQQALQHLDEAVTLYSELSDDDPEQFSPQLADCLQLRAHRLSTQGRTAEAKRDAERAVVLFRANLPESHRPDFAACLHNLGNWTIELDSEQAVALLSEAVKLYRALAESDLTKYQGYLHEALENQRRASPTSPEPEAGPLDNLIALVERNRAEAEADPDRYRQELARSLHGLGNRVAADGDHEGAVMPLAEAAESYELLVVANRDAHLPDLAGCLNDQGVVLAELHRIGESERFTVRAVDILRGLYKTNALLHRDSLAKALDNLVALLADGMRYTEALDLAREAVGLHRRLTELDPKHREFLATALVNFGVCLSAAGEHQEAHVVGREAVTIYEGLFRPADPPGGLRWEYAERLARALRNLAVDLHALRRRPEADICRSEAEELRQRAKENLPGQSTQEGASG